MVVRFNFERGKSCRYSTYTYSKQLGEFLRVGEGGHGPPRPPPKSATGGGDGGGGGGGDDDDDADDAVMLKQQKNL